MQCDQSLPNDKGQVQLAGVRQITQYGNVNLFGSRNDLIENHIGVWFDAPAPGKGLRAALRILQNSIMNLCKGRREFALAEQEVPVAPSYVGGGRIGVLCRKKSAATIGNVPFAIVGGSKIQPCIRRARVEGKGPYIVSNGALEIGIFQIVLPKTSEQV